MKILIIGASGLVGGNIYNYLVKHTNWEITGTYNKFPVSPFIFLDASEINKWPEIITKTDWDAIIHTGALTHVDKCEEESELSEFLTVKSTENLCKLAIDKGSKFIYISSDYVFDGLDGPYSESDIPNPLCVYGRHKLEAENLVKSSLSNYLIIRITNVYGNEVRNKNFLSRTIMQIKSNTNLEITAPYDQYATPVNALDIAKSILLLINDSKNGIYHIASTDFLNRVQFLQKINSYFGNKLIINPIKTNNLNQSAKRPLMGGLMARKFLNEYPEFEFSNIDDYLRNNIDFNV